MKLQKINDGIQKLFTGQLSEAICRSWGSSSKSKHPGCTNLRFVVFVLNNRSAILNVKFPRKMRDLINLFTNGSAAGNIKIGIIKSVIICKQIWKF